MNDRQLEQALRATLAAHADTVEHGPAWEPTEEILDPGRPAGVRRTRWITPLAAAAVVLAVVGGVLAIRGVDHVPGPAAAAQVPVPNGMQAVDALGVEIFVPKSFTLDDMCHGGPAVVRPLPRSDSPCPAVQQGDQVVSIAASTSVTGPACNRPIRLGTESGCPMESVSGGTPGHAGPSSVSVTWPRHGVSLTLANLDTALTNRILGSVHAVPIDRNGCAARQQSPAPTTPTPIKNIPDPANVHLTPPLPTSGALSVCLYTPGRRLAASAQLTGQGAATVASRANAVNDSFDTTCDRATLNDMYALVLERGGTIRTIYLPSCGGLAVKPLTTALTGLAHIPID